MLVRVRSNMGVWRVEVTDSASVEDVLEEIKKSRPHVVYETNLSVDPGCKEPLETSKPLSAQGIGHGAMIHCRVDPESTVDITAKSDPTATDAAATNEITKTANMRRIIDKDGTIKLVPNNDVSAPGEDKGFRKGMLPLRDMKMHWTLTDFVAMDSQYEFKITRQESSICKQVSLDVPSIADFQSYVQRFAFQRKRFAFLYGKFVPETDGDDDENNMDTGSNSNDKDKKKRPMKCLVEAIYEPPQEVDNEAAEGFVTLDDAQEETVKQIASMLGLTKVGWIFGHEEREKGYTLSAAEVIMAAEFQLEAAEGVEETPFVTVTVAPAANGTVSAEAFQVSQQCMAMVAEEALEVGPDPKICVVNETFTAIQEGKPSKTVENNFFLTVVPIVQHTSETFVAEFPRANRDLDERTQSHDEMKKHLQKSGTAGWTFIDRLSDFNLLIYLAKFLDVNADFPKICASIVDRSVPLDDGYKLIIKSMAGMDGAY